MHVRHALMIAKASATHVLLLPGSSSQIHQLRYLDLLANRQS